MQHQELGSTYPFNRLVTLNASPKPPRSTFVQLPTSLTQSLFTQPFFHVRTSRNCYVLEVHGRCRAEERFNEELVSLDETPLAKPYLIQLADTFSG